MPSKLELASTLAVLLTAATTAYAATTVQFSVTQPGSPVSTQTVYIKNGKVLVQGAGGDPQFDLLYNRQDASMTLINHGDRTFLTFNEQQVTELAEGAQNMMSTVQEQLTAGMASLPPEQAARMKEMLGSLGVPTEQPPPAPVKKILKKGTKRIQKLNCQQFEILKNQRKVAELCMAAPGDLKMSDDDYATIRAMQAFGEQLAEKAAGLARQFGGNVPDFGNRDINGVPIEMRDLSGPAPSSMTLTRLSQGTAESSMSIPKGYSAKPLPSLPRVTK